MYPGHMSGALEKAIRKALATITDDRDAGAVQLAITYAQLIDALVEPVEKVGPALLKCLESLGATPAARAALLKGATPDEPKSSPLDELRRRREQRSTG